MPLSTQAGCGSCQIIQPDDNRTAIPNNGTQCPTTSITQAQLECQAYLLPDAKAQVSYLVLVTVVAPILLLSWAQSWAPCSSKHCAPHSQHDHQRNLRWWRARACVCFQSSMPVHSSFLKMYSNGPAVCISRIVKKEISCVHVCGTAWDMQVHFIILCVFYHS